MTVYSNEYKEELIQRTKRQVDNIKDMGKRKVYTQKQVKEKVQEEYHFLDRVIHS